MLPRTGEVVIRKLANVQRASVELPTRGAIAGGSELHPDESDIDEQQRECGSVLRTVCQIVGMRVGRGWR